MPRKSAALELLREADNPHDVNAVAVAWGMDRGERLRARISRLSAHPNPARRIEFEVFIE